MGGGIAQTFALNGIQCLLADADADLARESVERLQREATRYESMGLFPEGASLQVEENLSAAVSVDEAVEGADYIAEAVPEEPNLKKSVLTRIADAAKADAVIASNTSAIPISELATSVALPERFLGAHWMNPAPFVPCVEIIPTSQTDPSIVDAVITLLRRAGKLPTRVTDSPGFVANRLQYALFKECARLVEEGTADPRQIDEVVQNSFGFRLPFFGPFAIADIAGLDVYCGGFTTMEKVFGERMATPHLLTDLVSSGRLGAKSLAGFYDYENETATRVADYRDRAYSRLLSLRNNIDDEEAVT